jgi:hypothetical protein
VCASRLRPPHGEALEQEPRLVRVAQVVDGERAHPGTAVRDVLGQAQPFELADGLAHGHRAHVQQLGKLGQAEGRTGRQLARQDGLLELGNSLLCERPVAPGRARRHHGGRV